jgi:hypothetical protein
LIIDPREMKTQLHPVNNSLEHQTGVTERSIGSYDWQSADNIIDDVVV